MELKKESEAKSEICIVKLTREDLINNAGNSTEDRNDIAENSFFATDYFDSLTVTKKYMNTPIVAIMNYENRENSSERKTSVQSYTLYYSKKMGEKYEKGTDDKHRRDPFEQGNINYRYLSIIQVHISPEIFRRSAYREDSLWKEDIILEPFIDDLYKVLYDYGNNRDQKEYCYRIYHVLSAGDLAVVIRSKYPETSFEISSRFRKRVVKAEKDSSVRYWTLYKTYTLFSIEYGVNLYTKEDVARAENVKKTGTTKFVIRGCYSNKYWSDKISNNEDAFGLNGKYDFSMDLTLKEFAQLYPFIQKHKGYGKAILGYQGEPDKGMPKVKYLKKLLEGQYLSYINVRCLLGGLKKDEENQNGFVSPYVKLVDDRLKYEELSEYNNVYINQLMQKFEQIQSETIKLRDAHKNLEQYFELMRRQILSCKTINQMSDTRIYVQKIGKQIEITLDSIELYRKSVVADDNKKMLGIMVENIRNAVHMVDCYMGYIRNNNLQSMQTPNYNIESSMSMEKILIGYNEYLGKFISIYMQEPLMKNEKCKKMYLPIVIPDLHYMDISVQVLFPEGMSKDWRKELEWRIEKAEDYYLMIVESPTLAELGDIPILMALLFHEMAHQFRYKSRKERNIVLLNLLVNEYVSAIATNIAKEICWNIHGAEVMTDLRQMIENGLKDAVLEEIKKYFEEREEKWEAPLIYFKDEVIGLLGDLSKSWNCQADMEETMQYFVKSIHKIENLCNDGQYKYLTKVKAFLDSENENKNIQSNKEWKEIREKLAKYSFIIAGSVICNILGKGSIDDMEWPFKEEEVEKWIDSPEKQPSDEWFEEMKRNEKGEKIKRKIEWIKSAFAYMCQYYQSPENDGCKNYFHSTEEILKKLYENLCEQWEEKEIDYRGLISGKDEGGKGKTAEIYRTWSLVGRYLGIDYKMDNNRKKCIKVLRKDYLVAADRKRLEQRVKIYREVTADMFMYIFMEMTPFTYLNLLASIIPNDNLKGINLERIITVLYVMEGEEMDTQVKGELSFYNYRIKMVSMWNNFIAYCEHNLETCKGNFEAIFMELEGGKKAYKDNGTNANLDVLIKVIKSFAKDNEDKKLVLIQMKKICELIRSIAEQEQDIISHCEETKVILEDYLEGKRYWQNMRRELKERKDILGDKKEMMKDILDLADRSRDYLNKEHYVVGKVENDVLNEEGIKFLLRCYYNQKIEDSGVSGK